MAVLWVGDLETENATFTSQWSGTQEAASDRITLVTSPVRGGTKAAKFLCKTTDTNVVQSGSGTRAEVAKFSSGLPNFGTVGQTSYVSFSWRWDSTYVPVPNQEWNFIHQAHDNAGGTQASAVFVYGSTGQVKWKIWGGSGTVTEFVLINSFSRDVWYDFILAYTWGKTSADGAAQAWVQSAGVANQVVARTACPTLYASSTGVYLKSGFYIAPGSTVDALGYGDCYQLSDSLASAITAFPDWNGSTTGSPSISPLPALDTGKARYGVTVAGSSTNGMSADRKRGSAVLVDHDAVIDSIWVAVQGNVSGTQPFKLVIYDATGTGGAPGAKVFESAEQSIVSPFNAEWVQVPVSPTKTLAAGTYWIFIISAGTANTNYYLANAVAGALNFNTDTYSDGAADPAGTMSTDNFQLSACLEGTPSTGGSGGGSGDVTPPSLVSASVQAGVAKFDFDEALDATSIPTVSDFVFRTNSVTATLSNFAVSGSSVTFSVSPVRVGDTCSADYLGLTVKDLAGNSAATFSNQSVINNTTPRQPNRYHGTRTSTTRVLGNSGGSI